MALYEVTNALPDSGANDNEAVSGDVSEEKFPSEEGGEISMVSVCGDSALGWDAKARKLLRYGELGVQDGDASTERWTPVALPPAAIVSQIAPGSHHSLLLTTAGVVFATGKGSALGLGGIENRKSIGHFCEVPIPAAANGRARAATYIAVAPSVDVGLNQSASFVLTEDKAFSCGSDDYGKLGRGEKGGPTSLVTTLQEIEMAEGERLVSLSAAKYHVLGVTAKKHLFAWGSGDFGKLGLGDDKHRRAPERVTTLQEKIEISGASESFSLALTVRGEIYTWGKGTDGQLGRGKMKRGAPKGPMVVELGPTKVSRVSTTDEAVAIVKTNGDVYVWGHSPFAKGVIPEKVFGVKDETKILSFELAKDKILLAMEPTRPAKRPRIDIAPRPPVAAPLPPPVLAPLLPPVLAPLPPSVVSPSPTAVVQPPPDADADDGADTDRVPDEDALEDTLETFIQSLAIPKKQQTNISRVLLREGFYSIDQLKCAVEQNLLGSEPLGFKFGICMQIKKQLGEL